MIHLTCRNCGWGLFGKAVMRIDAASVDLTCPRCKAVYRVSAVVIHDGEPQKTEEQSRRLAYTYDENHDRIALPDVSRQTTNAK
jgi:hypothetical protein